MEHISLTPFGRQPVTAGLLANQALARRAAPARTVDKWTVLNNLTVARKAFTITDRDIAVLSALVSFHKGSDLTDGTPLVVFPSNKTLGQRAHGMPESTLRRHLAALVRAGLVLRQDSPNGKRYARKGIDGALQAAYGFDLRPLLVRADEIEQAAQKTREAEALFKLHRERCVLSIRDAVKLLCYGQQQEPNAANWDALDDRIRLAQRALRRKLSLEEVQAIQCEIVELLTEITGSLSPLETEELSANDVQNERHLQTSNTYKLDSEQRVEKQPAKPTVPKIPLLLIRKACPELSLYGGGDINNWRDLVSYAEKIAPMIGIHNDVWKEACAAMGPCDAAISVGFILERIAEIKSPGAYLRALSAKAGRAGHSTTPMVMSLLNRTERRAA